MGYLDGLKVVTAVKPANISPIFNKRNRLTEKLYVQLECAKAKAEGNEYFLKYTNTSKTENGEIVQSEQLKKIKPWWYRSAYGKLIMEIRYANKRLELIKGKTGIEVDNINTLVPAIEVLIKAVESGELDNSINAASHNLRATLTK